MPVKQIREAEFDSEVAQHQGRVIIDFYATWCPPCRALAPVIDALAKDAAGRWVVGKLDTDKNPRTAGQFRISSIPTMLIFKNGQLVDQLVGLQPRQQIEAALRRRE